MTLDEALKVAASGGPGSVQIDSAWMASSWDPVFKNWSERFYPPGLVSIPYLRSVTNARTWRPAAVKDRT